jgi:hypothetical protein
MRKIFILFALVRVGDDGDCDGRDDRRELGHRHHLFVFSPGCPRRFGNLGGRLVVDRRNVTRGSFARPKMKSPGQLPLPARAKSVHTVWKRAALTVANHATAVLQSDDGQMESPGQRDRG